jgi:hypothetical protein
MDEAKRWDTFEVQLLGNLPWQGEGTKKKNFKGFPMFFTLENLKPAFLGDIKQWWSRHRRRRHRYRRRHRRSQSKVEKKMKDVKGNC